MESMLMANDKDNTSLHASSGILQNALLSVPYPTLVLEGENLIISYANEALFDFWGKDNTIIGKSILEVLPEIKNQPFPALLNKVLTTGETVTAKDAVAYVSKNGGLATLYCDYSYTPIKNNQGNILGVLVIARDVTEQVLTKKQNEEARKAIQDSHKSLQVALEAGNLGHYELNLANNTIQCTAQYKANFGFPADAELSRNDIENAILPRHRAEVQQRLNKALRDYSPYYAEYEVRWPDASVHWIRATGYAKYNAAGEAVTLLGVTLDITKDKQAEEKHAMLAAIVDSSDDAIMSKTLGGIITSWNKSAERMFGYTQNEIIGEHISTLIPTSRLHEEEMIIGNIARGIKVDHFETTRIDKRGKEISISLSVSPIKDATGTTIGASIIARDITERKQAEEKQAILASIVDTSDDTILSKTLKGIITSWNKAAERMFGYTEEEAIGKHISLLIPPDRLKEEDVIIGNIASGNKVDHFETVRVTKYGKEIPISLSVSPIKDSNGTIIGASKIARDISVQKQAQKASDRYTHSLETINSMGKIISEDLELNKILQKVTDATTSLTGAQFGAFFYNTINESGESLMLYTLSGAPKEAFEKFGMPRNTEVFNHTFAGLGVMRVDDITKDPRYGKNQPNNGMPDGHLPVVSYLSVPVISKNGEVIGGLFFGHPDAGVFTAEHENVVAAIASQAAIAIDNAKLYEEVKALNAKKDEFIGMASHELKTPLTSISGYMQILARNQTDPKSKQFVEKTLQQVKKLSSLVSDLLDVSKIEAGKLQLVNEHFDLVNMLNDAVELIRDSSASNHEIIINKSVHKLMMYGDKLRIEQAVINLLTNAIKYSPAAEKVELSLGYTDNKVTLSVRDFGIGIPKDKLNNIFSRFYRVDELNPHMSGLGIGLYITREIIERHGGKIWAESELGRGSTFCIHLPVAESR